MNGKDSGEYQVSVAANETVGAEGQTIMIIQADEQLDASQVTNALSAGAGTTLQLANIEVSARRATTLLCWLEFRSHDRTSRETYFLCLSCDLSDVPGLIDKILAGTISYRVFW